MPKRILLVTDGYIIEFVRPVTTNIKSPQYGNYIYRYTQDISEDAVTKTYNKIGKEVPFTLKEIKRLEGFKFAKILEDETSQ